MVATTRIRSPKSRTFSAAFYVAGNYGDGSSATLRSRQMTISEGHPVSRLGKNTGEDIGGDFYTERWSYPAPAAHTHMGGSGFVTWSGPVWAAPPPPVFTAGDADVTQTFLERYSCSASADDMAERGTTAIARCIPTNPVVSVASTVGELREGLPSLPGKQLLRGGGKKALGSEYLNLEFGIKPTISDVKKISEAYSQASKAWKQLQRDSGRIVRRRTTLPDLVSTESMTAAGGLYAPYAVYGSFMDQGTVVTKVTTSRRYSFSGAFTYHLASHPGVLAAVQKWDKLYGIIPDAEALWQLAPWSWAIDWVSNTGDILTNLSAFSQDGLVMRYGYIMCHTTRYVESTWSGNAAMDDGPKRPVVLTSSYTVECKQRMRATPYGFGLTWDSFSPRQLAILAALGISRRG